MSEKIQKEIDEFEESNNPVIGFFKEMELDEVENEPTSDIYRQYTVFCAENTLNPLSKGEFSKQVKKHYGLVIQDRRINGKKCRVFVSEG